MGQGICTLVVLTLYSPSTIYPTHNSPLILKLFSVSLHVYLTFTCSCSFSSLFHISNRDSCAHLCRSSSYILVKQTHSHPSLIPIVFFSYLIQIHQHHINFIILLILNFSITITEYPTSLHVHYLRLQIHYCHRRLVSSNSNQLRLQLKQPRIYYDSFTR